MLSSESASHAPFKGILHVVKLLTEPIRISKSIKMIKQKWDMILSPSHRLNNVSLMSSRTSLFLCFNSFTCIALATLHFLPSRVVCDKHFTGT